MRQDTKKIAAHHPVALVKKPAEPSLPKTV